MKSSIAELLSLPVDTVAELLEGGDLTAYTVAVLHVFEYDELVAQQVSIVVGPQRGQFWALGGGVRNLAWLARQAPFLTDQGI